MKEGDFVAWETTDGDIYTGIIDIDYSDAFLARIVSRNGIAETHPARYELVTRNG